MRNVEIEWGEYDGIQMHNIIDKFGVEIRHLKLNGPKTPVAVFMDLLKIASNIRSLVLNLTVDFGCPPKQELDFATDLLHLESVRMNAKKGLEILKVFESLPTKGYKIIEIRVDNKNLTEASAAIRKFKTIEELEIEVRHETSLPEDFLGDLKLKRLKIQFSDATQNQDDLRKLITKQTQLTDLDLSFLPVGDTLFEIFYSSMRNPKPLSTALSSVVFQSIAELRNLERLSFMTVLSPSLFQEFGDLQYNKISELSIKVPYNAEHQVFTRMAANARNLKKLTMHCTSLLDMFAVLIVFRHVETLILKCEQFSDQDVDDFEEFGRNYDDELRSIRFLSFHNDNLKELEICHNIIFNQAFINKLIASYPNLRKFTMNQIAECKQTMVRQFRSMLKKWPHLTHLVMLKGGKGLEDDDLDLIVDYGKNLKLVVIFRSKQFNSLEIKSQLEEKFGIVHFNKNGNLLFARDNMTLNDFKASRQSLFE